MSVSTVRPSVTTVPFRMRSEDSRHQRAAGKLARFIIIIIVIIVHISVYIIRFMF